MPDVMSLRASKITSCMACLTLFFAVLFCSSSVFANKGKKCHVRLPPKLSESDLRYVYATELLKRVLEVTREDYGSCTLTLGKKATQIRVMKDLAADKNYDVVVLPATKQNLTFLRPVRVPLRKGLLGWRVLVIHKDNLEKFSKVNSLEDLQAFTPGYEFDWGDINVLEENFPAVITSADYENLFTMLNRKRFDFTHRALHEAWSELDARKDQFPDLVVEPNLAIKYAMADYFFVNKNNKALAARISHGLYKLMFDGEFDRMFYKYFGEDLRRAEMHKRKVIELKNSQLVDNVPLEDSQLWFQVVDMPKIMSME